MAAEVNTSIQKGNYGRNNCPHQPEEPARSKSGEV